MSNDNGLIDEYEKLQKLKKELELKEHEIKNKIIELAKQKNIDVLFGSNKKCSIKEYQKVIFPEDKTQIIELIKRKGFYERVSSVNYLKLGSAIVKRDIDEQIINLTKQEKAFRLSFMDLGI